jgi:hydrogenase maturation protease
MNKTLLIGVGNEYRGDDAVGLQVARRVAALALPGVTVIERSGEGVALMAAWAAAVTVFIVDAVQNNGRPGAIYRFDAHQESVVTRFFNYSTHAFSVAEAIEMARLLGQLPPHLVVYGIEGQRFDHNQALTPAVAQAAEAVAERLQAELALTG